MSNHMGDTPMRNSSRGGWGVTLNDIRPYMSELVFPPGIQEALNDRADDSPLECAGVILRFGQPASIEVLRSGRNLVWEQVEAWWNGMDEEQRDLAMRLATERCNMLFIELCDEGDDVTPEKLGKWLTERDAITSEAGMLYRFGLRHTLQPYVDEVDRRLVPIWENSPVIQTCDPIMAETAQRREGWWAQDPMKM